MAAIVFESAAAVAVVVKYKKDFEESKGRGFSIVGPRLACGPRGFPLIRDILQHQLEVQEYNKNSNLELGTDRNGARASILNDKRGKGHRNVCDNNDRGDERN
ncbi:hypothetical protein CRUP_034285 [Coryphaenoides rupestris]|nr:hypothetical protein CRUP_034285 [Coryphaenoides rupestris]